MPGVVVHLPAWTRAWSALIVMMVVALGIGMAVRPRPARSALTTIMAPDFTLPAVSDGGLAPTHKGTLTLRSLRGHPVLLSFFLSTCGPCLDDLPLLRQAARAYHHEGLVVVGVATLGDTATAVRRLVAAAHLTYPIVVDSQATAWQYGVTAVPTSFFVDPHGHLVGQHIGPLDSQTIRDGLAQVGVLSCPGCGSLEPLSIGAASASSTTFSADFTFAPPKVAPYFELPDQHGQAVSPQRLRGKVVALTFISALCREQCPLIGETLSTVRRQLGAAAARLSIVSISVDPEVDTPAATATFAAESGWRGADWHYLSAPRSALARVWAAYGVEVPQAAPIFKPGQTTIIHQAGLFLLDAHGRLRAYYDTPFFAPRVASTIRALLAS